METLMMDEKEMLYRKKGQVSASIGGVIFLMVGLGVASLVQIFVGVLGGKTYQLTQDDIAAITNATIRGNIQDGISSSFEANKQTGELLPVVALAFMVILILSLLVSVFSVGGMAGGGNRGSAL